MGSSPAETGALAVRYLREFAGALERIVATSATGTEMSAEAALAEAVLAMEAAGLSANKIMFIGNGGSSAVASHAATDFMRTGGFRTQAFTDASMLTCFANDYGYERVYAEPIERMGKAGDLLAAISSSGRSPNILNGVEAARAGGLKVVTFSGFDKSNPLRSAGEINFYVPSHNYPIVEGTHMALIDSILQASVGRRGRSGQGHE